MCAFRRTLLHLILSAYKQYCSRRKAMVVYKELTSLECELGFSAKTLYAVSNSIKHHYHEIKIPKRSGGERTLSVPDEILKAIQRKIAERLLAYEPTSRYATAYKVASSVKKNALPHVRKKVLLKLDILGFFDHILYSTVKEKVFPSEKYSEQNRVLLSMLCYYKDVLPQGAPTSPVITNIIMRDFDERVGEWCRKRQINYTRYCDDMTFSGDFDTREVKAYVKKELSREGFLLNGKKTVVLKDGAQKLVTGIVVNEKPTVPKAYRRDIRRELYYVRTFGIEEHLARISSTALPQ